MNDRLTDDELAYPTEEDIAGLKRDLGLTEVEVHQLLADARRKSVLAQRVRDLERRAERYHTDLARLVTVYGAAAPAQLPRYARRSAERLAIKLAETAAELERLRAEHAQLKARLDDAVRGWRAGDEHGPGA